MLTHWRSITTRWAWLFLVVSLARAMAALFESSTDKRTWILFGVTFGFAVVWHVVAFVRSKKRVNTP